MFGWTAWLVSSTSAATLEIGAGGGFVTLQEAIAAARAGDRIEVHPGLYEGPVLLGDLEIELVALEGPEVTTIATTLVGSTDPTLVVSGRAAVTVRGFSIDGGAWCARSD